MKFDISAYAAFTQLIRYPLITEKTGQLYKLQQYTFLVNRALSKEKIKQTFQKIFNVIVIRINICLLPFKTKKVKNFFRKKSTYKKVYLRLKEDQKIPFCFVEKLNRKEKEKEKSKNSLRKNSVPVKKEYRGFGPCPY